MKLISLFLIIGLCLSLTSASDEELFIPCGGDEELIIMCIGDAGNSPIENPQIEQGSKKIFKEEEKPIELYSLLIIALILLILMLFFIRRRNKKIKLESIESIG